MLATNYNRLAHNWGKFVDVAVGGGGMLLSCVSFGSIPLPSMPQVTSVTLEIVRATVHDRIQVPNYEKGRKNEFFNTKD